MSAPLFLLEHPDDSASGASGLGAVQVGQSVRLSGEEGRHAVAVRRIRSGERIDLSDGQGTLLRTQVESVGRDSLQAVVLDVRHEPAPATTLTLAQALAKGGRDEQAVESATELGVDLVIPWQAARSVVRWSPERAAKSRGRWVSTAREATKQSRRSRLPAVAALHTTADLVDRASLVSLALVLHEQASEAITAVPLPSAGEVLVVVGPEGGVEDGELTALAAAGARVVRMGPHVLRSSSAGPAALAWLSAALGRWSQDPAPH